MTKTHKICKTCGETKPVEEFKPKRLICHVCYRRKQKKWYEDNKERINTEANENWHSLTPKEKHRSKITLRFKKSDRWFDELWHLQNECCAICKETEPGGKGSWHTDHDHATGEVRGFLCNRCNTGLGMFRDNDTFLSSAISYLAFPPSMDCTPDVETPVINLTSYVCRRCDVEKDVSEFHKGDIESLSFWCKSCRKAYHAQYYVENKSAIQAGNRNWNEENKEQKDLKQKEWNKLHPENIAAAQKRYREKKKAA